MLSLRILTIDLIFRFILQIFRLIALPKTSPKMAPKLQNMMECHSIWIFIQMIANAADVIPLNDFLKLIKILIRGQSYKGPFKWDVTL